MKNKYLLKKIIALAFVAVMAVSVTACSNSSSAADSSSSAESSVSQANENIEESSSDAESSAETDETSAESSTGETSEAPIDGSSVPDPSAGDEDFKKLFAGNAIDSDYLTQINAAEDVVSSVRAGNSAASRWKSQIEISLDELKNLDESAYDEQKTAQETWENNLDATIENIKSSQTTSGSLANIESAYNVMILYRERAAEVMYQVYLANGEVNVTAGVGEAQG